MLTATAVAATGLVATLLVTPLVISALRRRDVVDRPNHRSSHSTVTVRGAGAGLAVVASVAVVASGPRATWWVPVAAVLLAAVGFVDDLRGLAVHVRLPAQGVIAILASAGLALTSAVDAYWLLLGPLWIVGYLNAFNFMDGINGISAVHAATVGLAWAAASARLSDETGVLLGLVLAAVALGFLPYNFPVARAFLGDVGSYYLGTWIAVCAVLLSPRIGVVTAVLPAAVYVADTAWTLVARLRHGQRWSEPHRDHVYQQLVRGGWSHARATGLVGGVTAVTGVLAVWTAGVDAFGVNTIAASLGATVCAAYLATPHLVFDEAPGVERADAPS